MRQRVFAYSTPGGVVAGVDVSAMFTVNHPASRVWRYMKDFNAWQNSHGYYYTGIVGDLYRNPERDLGDEGFYIDMKAGDSALERYPHGYRVLKVVPERLIVISQPVPEDGGNGGVSPGFHVIMLNPHGEKTIVTVHMEHATRTQGVTETEALKPWRELTTEYARFWTNSFIPELKHRVDQGP